MLREIEKTRQNPAELKRRWFTSDFFDLFVYSDEDEQMVGFQLCYDKGGQERALVYNGEESVSHHRVDDGEDHPMGSKMSPLYVPDGLFSVAEVEHRFKQEAQQIDQQIRDFVLQKLSLLGPAD